MDGQVAFYVSESQSDSELHGGMDWIVTLYSYDSQLICGEIFYATVRPQVLKGP